ncbi:MAG: response regulator [Chloroflexi bacterium]|nr:response regulator [Chloroflexota bacterium]
MATKKPISNRILIIDDETLIRRTLSDYLTELGYETVTAANGIEGIKYARSEEFHAVMIDLRMPHMDGMEVIDTLSAEQPGLPLVVVSGTGVLSDAIEALRRGALDYISKPIQDMDEIVFVIERVLERARLVAERDQYQRELEQLNRSLEAEVIHQTQDLRAQNRGLAALNQIASAISNPLDLDIMLNRAIDAAIAATEADGGAVRLLNPATDQLVIAAARGLPEHYLESAQAIPLGEGIVGQVAQSGNPRLGHDFDNDPWMISLETDGFHAYLCVPLRAGDEGVSLSEADKKHSIVGTLGISRRAKRDFNTREIELLAVIGNQVGVAVARVRHAIDLERANAQLERLLAQIREHAQRVQQIVDTVPEGVLLLDTNRQVVLVNPEAERNLQILAAVSVRDTITYLGDRSLDELLISPPKGLWHEVATDGQIFEVIARSVSRATESNPTPGGWVMVIRDVTREREIEQRIQQQNRLAAVGQLAAGIAHDFNNIMATVVLYAQMVGRAEGLSDRNRERMATINLQAQHATKLIRQILDFSRRTVLNQQPMDLLSLLKEQVKLLKHTLPETIQIELTHGSDEHTIHGDPTRIQQVLMNLAINARDAMPEGGNLNIRLERIWIDELDAVPLPEMEIGEWVQVTVSDTGAGIPPDLLLSIFDPFFTTKAPGEGTGLGLAQVYGIVTQHEGYIDVISEIEKGTTFTFYLPALSITEQETLETDIPFLVQGHGETLLVVEDNTMTRDAVVDALQNLNYCVFEAVNGQGALAVFEEHQDQISLVITDLVMPVMGGQALFYALKQLDPTVKVIALTGHPSGEEVEGMQEDGLLDLIEKPLKLEDLALVVNQALAGTKI